VLWSVRPERITLSDTGSYPVDVVDVVDLGSVTAVTVVLIEGPQLRIRTTEPVSVVAGDAYAVNIPPAAITVWRGN